MTTIQEAIELANQRAVGQFHVFSGNLYHSTWRNFEVAKIVAAKQPDGQVYNDSGEKVA